MKTFDIVTKEISPILVTCALSYESLFTVKFGVKIFPTCPKPAMRRKKKKNNMKDYCKPFCVACKHKKVYIIFLRNSFASVIVQTAW